LCFRIATPNPRTRFRMLASRAEGW